ncbi:hypothetical protein AgCh_011965 [Apium graveolens]
MLDDINELVNEFRSARDHYGEHGEVDLEIRLKVSRSESGRENHVGPSNEVVGIMVGNMDETDGSRDIIIDSHVRDLEMISDIHLKLMALQYPLLFLHGCDGFHEKIPFGKVDGVSGKKWQMITMKEYYSYRFQLCCARHSCTITRLSQIDNPKAKSESKLIKDLGRMHTQKLISIKIPTFDRSNYTFWKKKMMLFIRMANPLYIQILKNGPFTPMVRVEESTDEDMVIPAHYAPKDPSEYTEPEKEKVSLDSGLQLILIESKTM